MIFKNIIYFNCFSFTIFFISTVILRNASANQPAPGGVKKVPSTTDKTWIDKLLSKINEYRALHSAPPLVYNQTLSEISQAWADSLAKTGEYDYNPDSNIGGFGENLYELDSNEMNEIVDPGIPPGQWYLESEDFDWNTRKVKNPEKHIDNFIQMVWLASKQAGAALATNISADGFVKRSVVVVSFTPPAAKDSDINVNIANVKPHNGAVPPAAAITANTAGPGGVILMKIIEPFVPGNFINVKGVITDPNSENFIIDLQQHNVTMQKGTIYMHFKSHFKLGYTEVKALVDGVWTDGTGDSIPILIDKNGEPFSITIYCKKDHFEIKNETGKRYHYNHTLQNLENIQVIGVYGQVNQVEIKFEKDDDYCYENCTEPSHAWPDLCETGINQSPIDLPPIMTAPTVEHFLFSGDYKKKFNPFYIQNNGHSIQITLDPSGPTSKAVLSGGGLEGEYVFAQMHFHWGDSDIRGSEHLIDGQSFPLEAHLVHYNKQYATLTEAVASNDSKALAVLGSFFKTNKTNPEPNPGLASVMGAISPMVQEKAQIVNSPIKLMDFISTETKANKDRKYYRYQGSLTTPPCAETVVWSVFFEPIKMAPEQLLPFKAVKNSNGHLINFNYRKIRPLGVRVLQVRI